MKKATVYTVALLNAFFAAQLSMISLPVVVSSSRHYIRISPTDTIPSQWMGPLRL